MSLDDTQNWETLRRTHSTHKVTCQECETIISCLEQEYDGLTKENDQLRSLLAKERDAFGARETRLMEELGEYIRHKEALRRWEH